MRSLVPIILALFPLLCFGQDPSPDDDAAAAAGVSIFTISLNSTKSATQTAFMASLARGYGKAYETPTSSQLTTILTEIEQQYGPLEERAAKYEQKASQKKLVKEQECAERIKAKIEHEMPNKQLLAEIQRLRDVQN